MKQSSLFRRVYDAFFGFDFFCRTDGRMGMATSRLCRTLSSLSLSVFLDSKDYQKGANWRIEGRRALSKSSVLIVLASPKVYESDPVFDEVEYFAKIKPENRIIVIDIERTFADRDPEDRLIRAIGTERIRLEDDRSSLKDGPSSDVKRELVRDFDLQRQLGKRLRIMAGIALSLVLLLMASIGLGLLAEHQRHMAVQREKESTARRLSAEARLSLQEFRSGRGVDSPDRSISVE